MDLTALTSLLGLLDLLPEPARTYARAAWHAFLACVVVSSVITAHTPAWAFKRWRVLRVFSFLSAFAPRDGAGTLKLPLTTPSQPGAMEDLRRLQAQAETIARAVAQVAPQEISVPPSNPQSGRASLGALVVLLVVGLGAGALSQGCTPPAPVDGGVAVTPTGWTSTARVVLDTLRWALPAARAITDVVVPEPARTQVGRALDATGEAARELSAAVDAYEQRGGDRCAAHAAVGGLHRALVGLARVLADGGIALGTTLERVVDGVASIADALVPACDRDAGWSSAGDRANAELRGIATGRVLRRVLDDLRPLDGGVR